METILLLTTIIVVGGFGLIVLLSSIEAARKGDWTEASAPLGCIVMLVIFPLLIGYLSSVIGKSNTAIVLIPVLVFLILKSRT